MTQKQWSLYISKQVCFLSKLSQIPRLHSRTKGSKDGPRKSVDYSNLIKTTLPKECSSIS